jgi:predicted RNase H-like HicB family nuclease
MSRSIMVRAVWDDEAQGWVATSEDVSGFVTGADTIEELHAKALPLIAELIELNRVEFEGPEIPVHILAEVPARAANRRLAA